VFCFEEFGRSYDLDIAERMQDQEVFVASHDYGCFAVNG